MNDEAESVGAEAEVVELEPDVADVADVADVVLDVDVFAVLPHADAARLATSAIDTTAPFLVSFKAVPSRSASRTR
ncbi:MAG TPA: hypothetical protein VG184_10760 [Acidimicrobiales bacterium]|nr:hypothetical protein [Acidimicrobiales bacterium]